MPKTYGKADAKILTEKMLVIYIIPACKGNVSYIKKYTVLFMLKYSEINSCFLTQIITDLIYNIRTRNAILLKK